MVGLFPLQSTVDVVLNRFLEIPTRSNGQKPFFTERLKNVFPFWDEEDYRHCLGDDLRAATLALQSLCLSETVVRLRFHEELTPRPVFIAAQMAEGDVLLCYATRQDAHS
jgi:hypothetical protein